MQSILKGKGPGCPARREKILRQGWYFFKQAMLPLNHALPYNNAILYCQGCNLSAGKRRQNIFSRTSDSFKWDFWQVVSPIIYWELSWQLKFSKYKWTVSLWKYLIFKGWEIFVRNTFTSLITNPFLLYFVFVCIFPFLSCFNENKKKKKESKKLNNATMSLCMWVKLQWEEIRYR